MVAFASLKDYGPNFQIKVINSLLKNKAFLSLIKNQFKTFKSIKWYRFSFYHLNFVTEIRPKYLIIKILTCVCVKLFRILHR
jgi:hypothetical protein